MAVDLLVPSQLYRRSANQHRTTAYQLPLQKYVWHDSNMTFGIRVGKALLLGTSMEEELPGSRLYHLAWVQCAGSLGGDPFTLHKETLQKRFEGLLPCSLRVQFKKDSRERAHLCPLSRSFERALLFEVKRRVQELCELEIDEAEMSKAPKPSPATCHAYMHACVHTSIHPYLPTYRQTDIHVHAQDEHLWVSME